MLTAQVKAVRLRSRSAPRSGRATLTTVRSRISMNCATLIAASAFQRRGSADACGSPGSLVSRTGRWVSCITGSYQGETWILDSPEGVCAGQAWSEYPATFVLFRNSSVEVRTSKRLAEGGVARLGPFSTRAGTGPGAGLALGLIVR